MIVDVPHGTIRAAVDGPADAPAVLMWNGAGCTLAMWDLVVERMAGRFRTVRFDIRGTGGSSPAPDATRYSLVQYADDANRVLDAAGVDRCRVWSMAWGSRAALAYVSLHPQRVISAAFYDASIGVADVDAQAAGRREAFRRQDATGLARFPMPDGWNTHEYPDEVGPALAAAQHFDLGAAAARLDLPLLVATGDHDPNLASSRELVEIAGNARLVVMEDVGHGSVLQRPDLALEIFEAFIGNTSTKQA